MAATEHDLIRAADNLTSAAQSLQVTLDVARRQRRRDRVMFAFLAVVVLVGAPGSWFAFLAAQEAKDQSRTNGEVLRIVEEVTSDEARARSNERLEAAIDELDRRLGARITEAFNHVVCEIRGGACP